jgi:hydroxyethylthiazole kinase-like uncharacterized protein yjeF
VSGWAYRGCDVKAAVARELRRGPQDRLLRKAAAGLGVVCARELRERFGSVYGRRVALLVGSGNNGADALLAGVRLRRRGVRIDALLTSEHAYEPGLRELAAARGTIISVDRRDAALRALARADLVLDGIVGESGVGGLHGAPADLVAAIASTTPVIAVDLPSGVEPDTGEIHGPHVQADLTVTFGAWKPALLLPPGCYAAGRSEYVDVGLPSIDAKPVARRLTLSDIAARWPIPQRTAHKYTRGVLGVVAGSDTYPGAAVLACMGAMLAGAGIVRYIGPEVATVQVLTEVPEAVPGIGQVQAWLLGSGVENDPKQDAAIESAL